MLRRNFTPPIDGLLMALVLGDKTLVPLRIRDHFSISGLAHLLAISGLHMTLVAAFLFFLIRRIFAFFPRYSELYDTKRPAAVLTVLCLSYYLFLCFASLSARRAFLMTFVFLMSIFVGRGALSIKNLVLSGMLILCIWPESLMMPSFQMSFGAVFGFFTYPSDAFHPEVAYAFGVPGKSAALCCAAYGLYADNACGIDCDASHESRDFSSVAALYDCGEYAGDSDDEFDYYALDYSFAAFLGDGSDDTLDLAAE